MNAYKKKKIVSDLNKIFNIENDLLLTNVVILMTIYLRDDYKDFAVKYHFNQKILKDFFKHLRRCFYNLFGSDKKLKEIFTISNNRFVIPKNIIEKTRYFFLLYNDLQIKTIYEYGNYEYILGFSNHSPYKNKLPLKNIILDLWINYPTNYINHYKLLKYNLYKFYSHRLEKYKNKEKFNDVIIEINQEVAYRPNKFKMLHHFQIIQNLIEEWNNGDYEFLTKIDKNFFL
jgi:hypothetical protein